MIFCIEKCSAASTTLFRTSSSEPLKYKNSLLTENLDLDYIETLIREKFLFGKVGEKIYIKKNEN